MDARRCDRGGAPRPAPRRPERAHRVRHSRPPERPVRLRRRGVRDANAGQGRRVHGLGLRAPPEAERARQVSGRSTRLSSPKRATTARWSEGFWLHSSAIPAGSSGRQETFAFDRSLRAYEPLYDRALRIAGSARNPYAATVALEAWFRTGGGFTYDESPPRTPSGPPPLVFFLEQSKAGYCQHYAGAMALMLRYLGIPSRVAAGFTSGTYDRERRVWNVSDRNAHTWVEVWFQGYGWLPFDPTPGRGNLSGPYSASSFSFDAPGAQAVLTASCPGRRLDPSLPARPRPGHELQRDPARPPSERRAGRGRRRHQPRGDPSRSCCSASRSRSSWGSWCCGAAGISRVTRAAWPVRTGRSSSISWPIRGSTCRPRRLSPRCVSSSSPQTGVDARRLVESLGLARFGPASVAAAAAKRARGELRLVRRRLRRSLSAGERLRGAFSVRSLLAR